MKIRKLKMRHQQDYKLSSQASCQQKLWTCFERGQSVEETGTLFTYEALKRDQEFVGYLKGNPED